jgi:hypothetical protein
MGAEQIRRKELPGYREGYADGWDACLDQVRSQLMMAIEMRPRITIIQKDGASIDSGTEDRIAEKVAEFLKKGGKVEDGSSKDK